MTKQPRCSPLMPFALATSLLFLLTLRASAGESECLQPIASNAAPTASDCLAIAQSAVGTRHCELCVCDANGSGAITADDSGACLDVITHQTAALSCPPCGGVAAVAAGQPVASSTTSSTYYYTTSSTTSTTVPVSPYSCTVQFSVTTAHDIGALQYDVDYGSAPGDFAGSGGNVQCVDLTGGLVSFNDDDGMRTLNGAVISVSGFSTPTAVAQCNFNSNAPALNPADFAITVIDASDPAINTIVPLPTMVVSSPNCVSNGAFCGNGIVEPGEQCDDGDTIPGDGCSASCTIETTGCDPALCDDDNVCNGVETCINNACRPGTPPICLDLDPNDCTRNECDPLLGCRSVPAPAGTSCGSPSDSACDNPDTCNATGTCLSNPEPSTTQCRAAAGACDVPEYCNGHGSCPADGFVSAGTPCDDGNRCTGSDTCVGAACVPGSPVVCNDGNACTDDSCDTATGCVSTFDPTNDPSCVPAVGRMTGGGRFDLGASSKDGLTHAFRLMCDATQQPNRLRLVWREGNDRFRFRLGHMRNATCLDNPRIGAEPPDAGFDTHEGEGTGTLQFGRERQAGATVVWRFTDAGEPNTQDDVSELIVRDADGNTVLVVAAKLFVGNHQAHAH